MTCPASDLIAAAATPPGASAVAVVRLSGPGAAELVEDLMDLPRGRLKGMRRKVGDFAGVDRLVALSWPCGASYTGEEMVDLMCHGTPGTAEAVMDLLIERGARPALPGEFTRRAWQAGRITAMDVLMLSARYSGRRPEGRKELEERLEALLVEAEAAIEFEEEHDAGSAGAFTALLLSSREAAEELASTAEGMELLPRAYIMGPVNSGKSTLFNALVEERAAVVSSEPGTTRDGAERTIEIHGRMVRLCDTAGTGGDRLDTEALQIALGGMKPADRVIWMDRKQEDPPGYMVERREILLVASQRDREDGETRAGWLPLSAVTGEGLKEVREFLARPGEETPSSSYRKTAAQLERAGKAAEAGDLALASEMAKAALEELNVNLRSGEAVERALETFCVGK